MPGEKRRNQRAGVPGGSGSADDVAEKLAVSKRTLQRRLTEEGTSFQKQLNNTREQFRKASHYHDEADANAMQIELEMIRECRLDETITAQQAKTMREEVYLMQTALLG